MNERRVKRQNFKSQIIYSYNNDFKNSAVVSPKNISEANEFNLPTYDQYILKARETSSKSFLKTVDFKNLKHKLYFYIMFDF